MNLTEKSLALKQARSTGNQQAVQQILAIPGDVSQSSKTTPQQRAQVTESSRLKRKIRQQGEQIRLLQKENQQLQNRIFELEKGD